MRILYLSRWYPFPPDNGAKIRTFNVVRQLAREHDVSLISFAGPNDQVDPGEDGVSSICRDVRVLPYRGFQPRSRRALAGFFSSQPRSLVDVHSDAFAGAVGDHLATREVDLIVASELEMVPYALALRDWPLVLEELELSSLRDQAGRAGSYLGRIRRRLMWAKLARYLQRSLPAFAACTVVSEAERRIVADVAPTYRNVHVVPNAVDLSAYRTDYGSPEPWSIVFAGALTYGANYEGACWMLKSVFPRVAAEAPAARLRITGGLTGVDVAGLPRVSGSELTGHLQDIHSMVARSVVSVVPLLSGGGTRLKILESMALGTPVVSTRKGAEGLDVTHGENILLADDPAEFARCVGAVLQDATLRGRLAESGRALVRARYDWDVVGEGLRSLIRQAATRSPSAGAEVRA